MNKEELRNELLDYAGTAAFGGMPAAFGDLAAIEQASETELKEIAQQMGIEISNK